MFQVSINLNVFYIPPCFLAFQIPLIFALLQLKTSEIFTLFQPIKSQIFCVLTIKYNNITIIHYNNLISGQILRILWTRSLKTSKSFLAKIGSMKV